MNERGSLFSAEEMHKLMMYTHLMLLNLSFSSCHFEMRMGVISGTELPVMLWYG